MNRKENVMVLFEFLMELLKEKEITSPIIEEIKADAPEPRWEAIKRYMFKLFVENSERMDASNQYFKALKSTNPLA